LQETPFPFPWAQANLLILIVFAITVPFIVAAYVGSIITAAVLTFAAVHTHFMLNEVSRDIEDPFHYDPNELPLPQMQYKLNERLLAVTRTTRPVAFTDVGTLEGPANMVQMCSAGALLRQPSASSSRGGGTAALPEKSAVDLAQGAQEALAAGNLVRVCRIFHDTLHKCCTSTYWMHMSQQQI
jgi:hypothetical protein